MVSLIIFLTLFSPLPSFPLLHKSLVKSRDWRKELTRLLFAFAATAPRSAGAEWKMCCCHRRRCLSECALRWSIPDLGDGPTDRPTRWGCYGDHSDRIETGRYLPCRQQTTASKCLRASRQTRGMEKVSKMVVVYIVPSPFPRQTERHRGCLGGKESKIS